MNILQKADKIIHGDRNNDYGSPYENHTLTAKYWNVYINAKKGERLDAVDVCNLNILQKISRSQFKYKEDNLIDIAGYAGNIEMVLEGKLQKGEELLLKIFNLERKQNNDDIRRNESSNKQGIKSITL